MFKPIKSLKQLPRHINRDNLHDALRQGIQSAIAAAVIFLVMKTFAIPETFLAILSAVLVVDRSIGNTMSNAKGRVLATVVGSAIGFVFVSLIPFGYGTVVSLIVTMLVMNSIASYQPSWRYGVVAAVAISLGAESDALQISIDRLIAIGAGISVGLLTTALIWPETATSRAKKHLRKALHNACDRFEISLQNVTSDEDDDANDVAHEFYTNLGNTKKAAKSIKFGDSEKIDQYIDATEKLYNSILIVHRVADSTDTSLLNEGDDSFKNADELNDITCEIIGDLIENKHTINDEKFAEMTKLIKNIKQNIQELSVDADEKILHHAFIFGIEEIQESLMVLKNIIET